jgi:tRNA U34 5-carboxymethylaminomethyl modifying GTPase MnmE/TrmE
MPLAQRKFRLGPMKYDLTTVAGLRSIVKAIVKRVQKLEANTQEGRQSRLDYISLLINDLDKRVSNIEQRIELWQEEEHRRTKATDTSEPVSIEQKSLDSGPSEHGGQTAEALDSTKKLT